MMALARLDWPAFCNILVFDGPLQGLGRQEEPLIADLLLTEISLSRSRPASVCPSVCLSVLKARVSPLGYIFPPSFHRLSLVSKKKKELEGTSRSRSASPRRKEREEFPASCPERNHTESDDVQLSLCQFLMRPISSPLL